jgi:uncharacterized protein (UPF0248 family)
LFKFGAYIIFFWSNEQGEPIHVHVSEGTPSANATKIWLTRSGGLMLAHNNSNIPQHRINQIIDALSVKYFVVVSEWKKHNNVNEVKFYC